MDHPNAQFRVYAHALNIIRVFFRQRVNLANRYTLSQAVQYFVRVSH